MAEAFVRVVLDDDAIRDVFRSQEVLDYLVEIAERQVIPAAQALAPHLSGAGAASIAWEPNSPRANSRSPIEVRVSWAKVYYYMYFHEHGAKHLPARPFLVPALLGAQ